MSSRKIYPPLQNQSRYIWAVGSSILKISAFLFYFSSVVFGLHTFRSVKKLLSSVFHCHCICSYLHKSLRCRSFPSSLHHVGVGNERRQCLGLYLAIFESQKCNTNSKIILICKHKFGRVLMSLKTYINLTLFVLIDYYYYYV